MKNLNPILIIVLLIILGIFLFSRKDSILTKEVEKIDVIDDKEQIVSAVELLNEEGNVTVSVESLNEANTNFRITLRTHFVELNYDLVKLSSLFNIYGNEYIPISWDGDPVGGHHRTGVLKFDSEEIKNPTLLLIRGIDGIDRKFDLSTFNE
ncbi:hypothetical protein COW81_01085 [Candidatus Campbellbacteria bacterium CG22_combo_CG10-13_8_21_14_all_36_13]|uniref:Uncharacterized protein n=1 Tax=Candidatus Campbellbacteria bacterium CG22_combo_CG10-13_8_21_14_all_36_13 TaxID=1974529 RepID=A0A2H0DYP7_9BACT|nr:MAG: hypothetical protein COW81_01085 [Candidatus Campbellbacteria bacterium CG22_combo_CG10-13_8_21_14_all_36_13]